ncbi:vesicle associated protein [Culex quinquefasciatus]|uniref:Vesicle associated protein n=1 Tax=Culex quinquefasciatus TaxID=7176 RepID=B0WCS1_CULQU|nr:vesicle associated protein [Culex quinquefasciatus]|eukprot:XP_001846505.1 vesicle associated protein [Culex quinquefasciatus]
MDSIGPELVHPFAGQPQSICNDLKRPSKWLKRPTGACFGFSGKLVTFNGTSRPVTMVTYPLVMLYRCMFTRNYADVSIQVNGHNHRVECLVTDETGSGTGRKEGQRSPTGPVLIKGKPSNTNIIRMQEMYPEQSPTSFAFKLKKMLQFNFTSPNKPKNRKPARIPDRGQGCGGPAQRPHRLPAARNVDPGSADRLRIYVQRTHIRTGSAGSLIIFQQSNGPASVHHTSVKELRCILEFHQQGPQMPETCRELAGETVMTGSMDYTGIPARSLRADLDYRKIREYEQEKFLSMVKQVKDAGATLAI